MYAVFFVLQSRHGVTVYLAIHRHRRAFFGVKRLVFIITTDSVVLILYTCHMQTRIDRLQGGMTMNFFEDELMKAAVQEDVYKRQIRKSWQLSRCKLP